VQIAAKRRIELIIKVAAAAVAVSGWRAGCRRGPATDAAAAAAAAAAGCLSCLPEYPHSPPQLADSLFFVIGHLSPPGHMTPDYSFFTVGSQKQHHTIPQGL